MAIIVGTLRLCMSMMNFSSVPQNIKIAIVKYLSQCFLFLFSLPLAKVKSICEASYQISVGPKYFWRVNVGLYRVNVCKLIA